MAYRPGRPKRPADRRRKQHLSVEYGEHAQKLDLPPAKTEEDFHRNLKQAQTLKVGRERESTEVQRASVDHTRLRGRVVYYRVREGDVKPPRRSLDPRSLVRKPLIKPDGELYPWLQAQLPARFDYVCCDGARFLRPYG